MATSYGAISRQASQGQKGNTLLDTWVSDGLALTQMRIINSAKNQNVIWDKGGILCREYNDITEEYEQEQLKIINTTLAITDDNWASVKTAIGKFYYVHPATNAETLAFGVNAETIVGKLLIGQELGLYNSSNTLTFDHNGLIVKDKVNNPTKTITISPSSSELFKIDTTKGTVFKVDDEGDIVVKGKITAHSGSFTGTVNANKGDIGGWTIDTDYIKNSHSTGDVGLYSGTGYTDGNKGYIRIYAGAPYDSGYDNIPFCVSSTGRLKATDAEISGLLKAGAGSEIGGWIIGDTTLYTSTGAANNKSNLINAKGNFIVNTDGIMTATGAILKGSNDASFKFSTKTNTWVPWGDSSSGNNLPVAILSNASYIVSRNIVTGVEVATDGSMSPTTYNNGTAAGFVHCRTTSNGGVYKARLGLNDSGDAFIQITNFDESAPIATFYFKQDGNTLFKTGS